MLQDFIRMVMREIKLIEQLQSALACSPSISHSWMLSHSDSGGTGFVPSQAAEKGPSASLRETRSLQRTSMYASARGFPRAPRSWDLFEQPDPAVFQHLPSAL
jgi:hypothetical protein